MVELKSNANNKLHLLVRYFSDIINVPSGVQMTLFQAGTMYM